MIMIKFQFEINCTRLDAKTACDCYYLAKNMSHKHRQTKQKPPPKEQILRHGIL